MGWYNTNGHWKSRKEITINKSNIDENLTNFPVRYIERGGTDLLTARDDGNDILFTDSDGKTKIPHELVEFNKILERDAVWSWHNKPEAIHYVNTQDRTYVSWITKTGSIMIGQFDHTSKVWSTFVIKTGLNVDDHSNPAVEILPNGKIIIMYSNHNGASGLYRISSNVEDISAWDSEVNIGLDSEYTYLRPFVVGSNVYCIWRGPSLGGNERANYFSKSTDNAATWSAKTNFLNITGKRPYVHASPHRTGNRVDFCANQGNLGEETTSDLYHFYFDDSGGSPAWKDSAGNPLTLPITDLTATKVFDSVSAADKAQVIDVHHNYGRPVLLWGKFVSQASQLLMYSVYNGSWVTTQIADMGDAVLPQSSPQEHYTGNGVLDTIDPRTVYYSKVETAGSGGKDIHHIYKSYTIDNGTTWIKKKISQGNDKHFRPVVPINRHATEMNVFWIKGGYAGYTKYYTNLQCYPTIGKTADIYAVFKVPSISKDSNKKIFMYYGNTESTPQEDPNNVFDANTLYRRLGDITYTKAGIIDLRNLTQVTTTIGLLYNGVDGADEYLCSNWSTGNHAKLYIKKETGGKKIRASIRSSAGASVFADYTDLNLSQNALNAVTSRYYAVDGTGLEVFVNSVKSSIVAASSLALHATIANAEMYTGDSPHVTNSYLSDGYVDYLVISNIFRSDAWVKANHVNLYDQNSFLTVSAAMSDIPSSVGIPILDSIDGLPVHSILTVGNTRLTISPKQ